MVNPIRSRRRVEREEMYEERPSRVAVVRQRPAVIEADATIRVTSSGFAVEEGDRVEIDTQRFLTDPAYVRINHGVTKNMGNYESLRVDVSITMPCYQEEAQEVADRVSNEVFRRLDEELAKYNLSL